MRPILKSELSAISEPQPNPRNWLTVEKTIYGGGGWHRIHVIPKCRDAFFEELRLIKTQSPAGPFTKFDFEFTSGSTKWIFQGCYTDSKHNDMHIEILVDHCKKVEA